MKHIEYTIEEKPSRLRFQDKWYLVTIEITHDTSDYEKGEQFKTVVRAKTEHRVEDKVYEYYQGLSYPSYKVIDVEHINYGIFTPIN
jgi:hypothetical protein